MVTLAGTATAGLPLDRDTFAPPLGAAPFRLTVPVEELPPVRLRGLSRKDVISASVSAAVIVTPPKAKLQL